MLVQLTSYGWSLCQNCFEPNWFPGSSIPESLTCIPTPVDEESGVEATSSDNEEAMLGVIIVIVMTVMRMSMMDNEQYQN